ncbi:lecithin retinol acyltransferase family protein [Pseudanabaena yagii]|uniref:LRAT domain-containing protein n=1 Tax=Pseudanabaena yagii GIHE-NHR1 TaxID=2722753 RepID=A0ABX1LRC5_9CYAN|nr:lecithin retinol acyltransferase family protein [Pseudanabaena yagii]NMF58684.1 hypothetical protein [Pseudanabaena yagii GIHE-NHR1]
MTIKLLKRITHKNFKGIRKSVQEVKVLPKKLEKSLEQANKIVPVVIRNPLDSTLPCRKDEPYLGAHIFVVKIHPNLGLRYQHHGIYVGENCVIHLMDNGIVSKISLKQFRRMGRKHRYGIIHSPRKGSHKIVVERANKLLRRQKLRYNLLNRNCEHFAHYCRSGAWRI